MVIVCLWQKIAQWYYDQRVLSEIVLDSTQLIATEPTEKGSSKISWRHAVS